MKAFLIAAAMAVLACVTPAHAQTPGGILVATGDRLVARQAMLSFPKAVAGLAYTKSIEFSHPGENLDNAVQYNGPGGLWATVYVYRAGYPDAAIAAFETERVMNASYGGALKREAQGVVPFVGAAAAAIRIVYSGAAYDGQRIATASAFARVGPWVVKFRVSGPDTKPADVATALDALLAGTRLEGRARIFPVALPDIAPCPERSSGTVKVINDDKGIALAFISSLEVSITNDVPKKKGENPFPPLFPANGLSKICQRAPLVLVEGNGLAVLQSTEPDQPGTVMIMLSDAGDMALVKKDLSGDGYTLSKVEIGRWTVLGQLDRLPDNGELIRLFKGQVPGALAVRATTTFNADGNSSVNVATGKK